MISFIKKIWTFLVSCHEEASKLAFSWHKEVVKNWKEGWKIWKKTKIYKIWEKNWEDTPIYKTKETKKEGKIVQENVYEEDKVTKVVDKIIEGRKHEFGKRLSMFFLSITLAGLFCLLLWLLGSSFLFRLTLCAGITWFFVSPLKGYSWWYIVGILSLLGLVLISVAYLPEFQSQLIFAYLLLVAIASVFFGLEEVLNKNIYPRLVPFAFAAIVLFCFGWMLVDLFESHEYYATKGTRAEILVQDKLEELKSYEILKARLISNGKIPSAYRKAPPELTGYPSDTPEIAKNWFSLFVKNHMPAEYGRIEAVLGKVFFIVFFTVFFLISMVVAVPEIFGDVLKKSKVKTKAKGEKTSRFTIEVVAELFREFFAGHAVGFLKKGR